MSKKLDIEKERYNKLYLKKKQSGREYYALLKKNNDIKEKYMERTEKYGLGCRSVDDGLFYDSKDLFYEMSNDGYSLDLIEDIIPGISDAPDLVTRY